VTTDSQAEYLSILSKREHAHCIVCGAANQQGLRLQFTVSPDGSVKTVFPCSSMYQDYSGVLHGGITSCLLDGAMTNCLFANSITATTGELTIRYLHPVRVERPATVKARITRSRPPLHLVEAGLSQEDILLVRATAKFMESGSE